MASPISRHLVRVTQFPSLDNPMRLGFKNAWSLCRFPIKPRHNLVRWVTEGASCSRVSIGFDWLVVSQLAVGRLAVQMP